MADRAAIAIGRGLLLTGALSWSLVASSQVPVPPLTGHVVDESGTLTADQRGALEQRLTAFEASKGSQVSVLVVTTTAPEGIEEFSVRVAQQWKLGRKKVDDGAVLVVAKGDHAVRIEVGYGLEGALTDLASKRIIDASILPRFKEGDFYGGISAGVAQMLRVIEAEPLPAPAEAGASGPGGWRQYAALLFILALTMGGVLRALLGKVAGPIVTGGAVAVIAWLVVGAVPVALGAGLVALVVKLLGGGMAGRGTGGGVFLGGGRGGTLGGGGGFLGGGGGFGGGGASGRW